MIDKLLCFFFGHRYYVLQVFSPHARRVQCTRCRADWGMNDHVSALIDWDAEIEQLYQDMGFRIRNPKFGNGEPRDYSALQVQKEPAE